MKTLEIMRMRFRILLLGTSPNQGENLTINNTLKSCLLFAFLPFDCNMHLYHYKQLFFNRSVSLENAYHLRLLQPRFHSGRVTKRYHVLQPIFNPNCSISPVTHSSTQSPTQMKEIFCDTLYCVKSFSNLARCLLQIVRGYN